MISKVTIKRSKAVEITTIEYRMLFGTTLGGIPYYVCRKHADFSEYYFRNAIKTEYTAKMFRSGVETDLTTALHHASTRLNILPLNNQEILFSRVYLGEGYFGSGDQILITGYFEYTRPIATMTNVTHSLRKDLQSCYDSDSTSSWNKYKEIKRRTSIQVDRFSHVEMLSEFYDVNDKESFELELEMRQGFKIKGDFVASTFNENGSADLRTDNITFDSQGEIVKV